MIEFFQSASILAKSNEEVKYPKKQAKIDKMNQA
jgi:hypothetical protein